MYIALDREKIVTIIATSFYLASKINEFDKIRIRDIINVCYYQLNENEYVENAIKDN